MPFVAIHKARKPKARVPEVRGYGIADGYVKRFAAAWQMAVKGLASQIDLGAMRKALERQSIQGAIEAIPLYDEGDEKSRKLWGKLGANLRDVFRDLMTAAGQDAYDRLKLPLRFKIEEAKRVPTVPINPYSARWIEQQAGKLIEDISDETGGVVRAFILGGFTEGIRAESMAKEIKQRVGLFPKWAKAVDNRFALHIREGLSVGKAGRLSEKYRQQLLKKRAVMIARTETITAQAQGRRQAWQVAQESGHLPADIKRRWIARAASANPDRPCEICLGLDGQVVGINEPYHSDIIGDIMGPTAHPNCSCTELLIRPGEKVPEISTARRAARLAERKKRLDAMRALRKPRRVRRPGEPVKRIPKMPLPPPPPRRKGDKHVAKKVPSYAEINRQTPKYNPDDKPDKRIGAAIANWVHGSRRRASVLMKQAAKEELGLKGISYSTRDWALTAREIRTMRADVRALYEETQAHFKAQGVKTVRLYRGVRSKEAIAGALESWTTELEVAKKFDGHDVMVMDVPVGKILTFHRGPSWRNGVYGEQWEYIVME